MYHCNNDIKRKEPVKSESYMVRESFSITTATARYVRVQRDGTRGVRGKALYLSFHCDIDTQLATKACKNPDKSGICPGHVLKGGVQEFLDRYCNGIMPKEWKGEI